MTDVLQFGILGLAVGSIYGLLACGLVLVYRGSGTINLAHGHVAMLAAFLMVELRDARELSTPLAWGLVLVASALLGVFVQLLIMRPLRNASPLARVIATLGVLTIINESVTLKYGATQQVTDPLLPTDAVTVDALIFGEQTLWLVGIAAVVAAALTLFNNRTRTGLAVSAAAENATAAAALGWSTNKLSVLSWGAGCAIAGLAGTLVPSTTSGFFAANSLSLLIVGTLAAALLAEFRSFPLAIAGGWLIGVAQSEAVRFVNITGLADAVPLLFIVLLLVVRGRGLPVRGSASDRLPNVGSGRLSPAALAVAGALAIICTRLSLTYEVQQAIVISASLGIVALSVVVVTGYAGQLSLAQMALAGVGAYAAGRLVAAEGWTFGPAVAAGVVSACAAGLVLGLPALRTRGVNLTVVTFSMGFAVFAVLFNNPELTGGIEQTVVPPLTIFGVPLDPLRHLDNYATLCVFAFAAVGVIVANVRRGRVGRRLLAVRSSERAAASIGVNVFAVKLYAFTLSAAIAGLGGVLYAFLYSTITYPQLFTPFASISLLTAAVIGGVGWVLGPYWGCLLVSGGLGLVLLGDVTGEFEKYVPLAGGVILILTLIVNQNGIAPAVQAGVSRILPHRARDSTAEIAKYRRSGRAPGRLDEVQPLVVSGLTQRFGGVTALEAVSLTLQPGRVLGVLGPNGAGKTTLIDAVSGFVKPSSGRVLLGTVDVTGWSASKRVRHGVSRTFQNLELFDDLTVRENLLAACERRDWSAYVTDLVWPGRSHLTPGALAAVEELDLADLLDRLPPELSYGQRRLVAIARAVAAGPSVLLLDEPGAGLDETETAELGHLVRRLADDWGMAVLMIEHDVTTLLRTSDDVVVLDFGRKIFEGPPEAVPDDEAVRTAYLGLSHA